MQKFIDQLHLVDDPKFEIRQQRRSFLRTGFLYPNNKESMWSRASPVSTSTYMSRYEEEFYCPPTRTTAGLMFPARSKFTVRGFTHAKTPADGYWRQIISASQGERDTCLLALSEPDLWNIYDQPKPVSFIDIDGSQRTHRFDFLSVLRDGTKVAMAVKPEALVQKLNFRTTLAAIRRSVPTGFADRVVLVTERNRHPVELENARLLNFFRRTEDVEADLIIADQIRGLSDELSIAELIQATELRARGYRAAFRAIYTGLLQADLREFISLNSSVLPIGAKK